MDLEFLGTLGWREALVAIVALLTLYILYILLRINRLRREVPPGHDITSEAAGGAVRAYSVVQESEAQAHAVDISTAGHQASLTPGPAFPTEEQTFPWNEPPRTSSGLLSQPRIEVLEQELAQLRRELGALRSEIQTLRDVQRREPDDAQAAPNPSPFYSEAMRLAVQGREPSDISVLCGISRAEADLVVALVRNKAQVETRGGQRDN